MISVEEALDRILSYVTILDGARTPILECLGQVLAEDIYSSIDIPPKDNSAMDGYAVRAKDTSGASAPSPAYHESPPSVRRSAARSIPVPLLVAN